MQIASQELLLQSQQHPKVYRLDLGVNENAEQVLKNA
jgi:hypothetical protein